MVVWTQEPIEVTVSEATSRANLRQWSALARQDAPGDYALPFHEAEEPCTARCDACGREADLEEMVQGRDCTLFCADCRDVRTDGGWAPEEWGFDGEGEGR